MIQSHPRLSVAAREAILRGLSRQSGSAAVPISRVLHNIRTDFPALRESDEDLIRQIVIDATGRGLAVYFDREHDAP